MSELTYQLIQKFGLLPVSATIIVLGTILIFAIKKELKGDAPTE